MASAILLIVKTNEFISSPSTSSLLFGLGVVPLVLLLVLTWMLAKLLVGRRVEVVEVED